VSTSVHTHGAYVDGDSDGHPNDLIQPGKSKTYYFGNDQTARTQWYHDHAMHTTASSVYKGLAGLYLIEDEFEDDLPLPKDEYDVPLVIQDRLFNSDGSFDYSEEGKASSNGVYGNVVLVNGKPWPRMAVSARKYRFRILNGSNARAYDLALSTGEPFAVIATEGGMMSEPVLVRSLPISPAERYEVIVDFSKYPVGTKVVLKNRRRREKKGAENVMRFDVVRKARDDSLLPAVLRPPEEQIDPTHLPVELSEVERTREFVFKRQNGYWSINGKTWDGNRIDEHCREGQAEVWELKNNGGGWIHPVHIHLLDFKIIERDGRPPAAYEAGWKETVFLDENQSAKVLLKWPRVPEGPKPGRYVRRYPFHCHVVEHEDHDMMLQFQVAAA
jgi:FtsP/CotA-like multicopper oxidase with cupredoxin domain